MDLTQSPGIFFVAVAAVAAESTEILSFEGGFVEEVSVVKEILVRDAMAKEKHREGKGIKGKREEDDGADTAENRWQDKIKHSRRSCIYGVDNHSSQPSEQNSPQHVA